MDMRDNEEGASPLPLDIQEADGHYGGHQPPHVALLRALPHQQVVGGALQEGQQQQQQGRQEEPEGGGGQGGRSGDL